MKKMTQCCAVGLAVALSAYSVTATPANDAFANAIQISGVSGNLSGSNAGATIEASEQLPAKYSKYATGSVWYKWTAPFSGPVTFDTMRSGFDTILGVYTGTSASALTEIASDDDDGASYDDASSLTFEAQSGTTYMVAVYGYNCSEGAFQLNWANKVFGPGKGSHFFVSATEQAHVVGVYGLNWSDFVLRDDGFRAFVDDHVVDREKHSGAAAPDHVYCSFYSEFDALVWAGWTEEYSGIDNEDEYVEEYVIDFEQFSFDGAVDVYYNASNKGKNINDYCDDVCFDSSSAATLSDVFANADRLMLMTVTFGDDYDWYGVVGSIAHAVVCCGYSLDTTKSLTDPTCLKGLFIIDPDNDRENNGGGEKAPDTITYCPVAWDAANNLYKIQGVFGAVGYVDPYAYTIRTPEAVTSRWSLGTVNVTFNANGGGGEMASQTFTAGLAQGLAANAFTRIGYAFAGWATSPDGAVIYTDGQSITAFADMVLYAKWTEIVAGRSNVSFSAAQTLNGALYKGGKFAGTMQVKLGKINKKRQVNVSVSAMLLMDGKAKKVNARANVSAAAMSATIPFKEPIGNMKFTMAPDGSFTLKNATYVMGEATVGAGTMAGGSRVTFRLDGFNLAVPGELQSGLLPYTEPVSVSGGKWTFSKAAKVKLSRDKTKLEVDTSAGRTNLSGVKLNYTAKTGQFKGTFKAYALEGTGGGRKLKNYTVNVIGFVINGVGYGEASCKRPAGGPWTVTVE